MLYSCPSLLFHTPADDSRMLAATLARFFAASGFKPDNSSQLSAWILQMQMPAPHMAKLDRMKNRAPAQDLSLDAAPPTLT